MFRVAFSRTKGHVFLRKITVQKIISRHEATFFDILSLDQVRLLLSFNLTMQCLEH